MVQIFRHTNNGDIESYNVQC